MFHGNHYRKRGKEAERYFYDVSAPDEIECEFDFAEMKIISKNFGNGTYSFELAPETECLI